MDIDLKDLPIPYILTGSLECSIDNSFIECDGCNRMPQNVPTKDKYQVYHFYYVDEKRVKKLKHKIATFSQQGDKVFFSLDGISYEVVELENDAIFFTDGVHFFFIKNIWK